MLRKIDKDAFRVLISLGVFFLFFGVGMVGIAISDELTMPPEGEVPSIDAFEAKEIVPDFQGLDDGPAPRPNHPPMNEIPSLMPREDDGLPSDSDSGPGAGIYHDSETEETVVGPMGDTSVFEDLAQGGGYTGADGSQNLEEMPMTFYDMYIISNTQDYPWRMNTKLVIRFEDAGGGDHFGVCSGTMRDAETVLTAGHCVYDRSHNWGWAKEIWVYPGWDGVGGQFNPPPSVINPYGWARSTLIGSWTGWTNNGDLNYDVGIIGADRAVGMLTGWFGWAYGGSCSYHLGLTYNNASYPAECCNPPSCTLHNGSDMYYWYGYFDSCPSWNRLQIDTSGGCFNAGWGGMSGSGAYYIDSGNRYVHGIASTSDRSTYTRYSRQFEDWVIWNNDTFIPDVRGSSFDLQALDVNAEPATIEAGQSTTLLNHLATNPTNGSASGTWTLRVYLSTNDNISTSDTLLSTQYYSYDFNVMSSVRVNMVQVTIPANTPAGNYWLGVIYDSATDGNSANNDTDGWDANPITVFCPTPGTPSTPNPSNGATGISIDADLDWSDCSNTDSYDVYFGTSSSPPYYGNISSSNYSLPTLNYSTHYYWKIVAKNDCGNSAPGPVWDFTTSSEPCPTPGTPSTPNPSNGATGISIDADLDWSDCSNTDSYDVYFGTSSSPPYYGNISSSNYSLPTLNYSTHYYWKIVAKNDCGNSAPGPVWDFTTGTASNQPPVIDSFTADPTSGEAPLEVTFTCDAHDTDGDITEYRWDFDGDGTIDQPTTTNTTTYTYNNAGTYDAVVTVVDNEGATTTSDPITINVGQTEATLTLDSQTGMPDSTADVPGYLDENNTVVGCQFDVVFNSANLESGGSTQPGAALDGTDFSVSSSVIEPGKIRIIIIPPTVSPFPIIPNGEIVIIPFHIKADAPEVCEPLNFENVIGSDKDSNPVLIATSPGEICITQIQPGDANGDGSINVLDVICIINVILDPAFNAEGNPDCNEDGSVNVLDVICVINKILGG